MNFDVFLYSFASKLLASSFWSFGIAFIGGILSSAVCPCTLPVGVGVASVITSSEVTSKKSGVFLSIAFFIGIVISLIVLSLLSARIGNLLTDSFGKYWSLVMAIISLIAGVVAFLGLRFKVNQLQNFRKPGVLGSFTYGFIFSLGTSAAPLLLLLTIASTQNDLKYATSLALFFGIGRGMPFLLIGLFSGLVSRFAIISRSRKSIQIISGITLLFVGFYFFRTYMLFNNF